MADNPRRWITLTTRYGQDIENPSPEDLSRAMEELRQENAQGKGADAEHAIARLRLGSDDGPRYILSVDRDGTTSHSEFTDEEADDPVEELTRKLPREKALALWILLAKGSPDKVAAELRQKE